MSIGLKSLSLFILIGLLQACATSTTQTPAVRGTTYQSATTANPYMFRGPNPGAASAIRAGRM